MPPEDEQQANAEQHSEDAPSTDATTSPTETTPEQKSDAEGGSPEAPTLEALIAEHGEALFEHEAVQSRISSEVEKAQNRARSQTLAEQRRKFANPEVVEDALLGILTDAGLDAGQITRSMRDKANTLYSTSARAAMDLITSELPKVLLENYEFDQETMTQYLEHQEAGRTDVAWKLLIDNAVSQQVPSQEELDARVKVAADELRKAEQEAANGANGTTPPATTAGGPTSSYTYSLTSMEIGRMPASTWRGLPDDAKEAIKANVAAADAERGADAYDPARILALEAARP